MDRFNKLMAERENQRPKKDVGDYVFKFGKYNGRSYNDVYETDKSYVHFCVTKLDPEKNKVLIEYFKQRIEEEYGQTV
jgi:hypothetical protein